MVFLLQQIKAAYKFTAGHGESGALGALQAEIKDAKGFLQATIGVSKANSYLANLEFGERGTKGGSGELSRTKAPPVANILKWLKLAKLQTPDYYVKRALRYAQMLAGGKEIDTSKPWYSLDPQVEYAFAIALKRKRYGLPALHNIQKTAERLSDAIRKYLEGAN